jgi:hypothetical protein
MPIYSIDFLRERLFFIVFSELIGIQNLHLPSKWEALSSNPSTTKKEMNTEPI